ncbi:hypothetical protein [Kibdelosporangium aridum]|uniref:Uncharacterized protein n=1 Tax=Kibdelosporangium aridum TaxID=2030 RepID=A0A1Y5YCL6_KIBAR|nr:hypothetical protein [Kibdelosporangium aridum]SMD27082.1 hypothetical protein SAMN05661093_10679 [Kibdelosporangium aridum]
MARLHLPSSPNQSVRATPEGARTPILDNAADLLQTAITVEQLAEITLDAIHASYISTLVQKHQQIRGSRDA